MSHDEIFFNKEISLWWPVWDTKPNQNYIYILKHLTDMDLALSYCKQKRVCIQAGGHVGLWPMRLSQYFDKVFTFEAEPTVAHCLQRNVQAYDNIYPTSAALSDEEKTIFIQRSGSSGSNRIKEEGSPIQALTIDNHYWTELDAIFLDVEHHELQVLKGAITTIKRFNPVIQAEELEDDDGVKQFLQGLGYKKIAKESKDAVYIKAE